MFISHWEFSRKQSLVHISMLTHVRQLQGPTEVLKSLNRSWFILCIQILHILGDLNVIFTMVYFHFCTLSLTETPWPLLIFLLLDLYSFSFSIDLALSLRQTAVWSTQIPRNVPSKIQIVMLFKNVSPFFSMTFH